MDVGLGLEDIPRPNAGRETGRERATESPNAVTECHDAVELHYMRESRAHPVQSGAGGSAVRSGGKPSPIATAEEERRRG